ncbi:MAG: hypothetical protein SNF33_08030 [Candidatus Algichlamydia australiensis]|nr:hypothetical protein [Chlamydiales bacterium]
MANGSKVSLKDSIFSGLGNLEEKMRTSPSFFAKVADVGADALHASSLVDRKSSGGWVRATYDLKNISAIQTTPETLTALFVELGNSNRSFRTISIHFSEVAAKVCKLIAVFEMYGINVLSLDSYGFKIISNTKCVFSGTKAALKAWKSFEKNETVKMCGQATRFISQSYRVTAFVFKFEKSRNFLYVCKLAILFFDGIDAWNKKENKEEKKEVYCESKLKIFAKSTKNLWTTNTSFVKYSTASVTGSLSALDLIEGDGRDGLAAATKDLNSLSKMQKIYAEGKKVCEATFVRLSFIETVKNILSFSKTTFAILLIGNKYGGGVPSWFVFSQKTLTRGKLGSEVIHSFFGSYYSLNAKNWERIAISKAVFSVNLSTCLLYLNYTHYAQKRRNALFLLALSINGIIASIALAYFTAIKKNEELKETR